MSRYGLLNRRRYIVASIAILIGFLYLVSSYFLVPWYIHGQITAMTKDYEQLRPNPVGEVHFNPFTYQLTVERGNYQLTDEDLISFRSISLDFEPLRSVWNWTPIFESLQIDEPKIHVRLGADRTINWQNLTNQQTESGSRTGEHSFYLGTFDVTDGTINWSDVTKKSQVDLTIDQFSLQSSKISWPNDDEVSLAFAGRTGTRGNLSGTIDWNRSNNTLQVPFQLKKFPIKASNDYLKRYLKAQWDTGILRANGSVKSELAKPGIELQTSVVVREAELYDTQKNRITKLNDLSVDTLTLNTKHQELDVENITLDDPYFKISILEGYQTNVGSLLRPQDPETPINDKSDQPQWKLSMGPTRINAASIDFKDENVPGGFSSLIHDLTGTIDRFSTEHPQPASITLQGRADERAQLKVDGQVVPFNTTQLTSINLDFENIPLVPMSPYMMKYIGHRVDSGKMNLNLKYKIKDSNLDGSNRLVLDQFELGERVNNEPVFSYPMDLVLALLKNNEGVIDLDIPVSGSLRNPQFDLSQVIRRAINNTISSIVTSPFQILAKIVGTDASKLESITFVPTKHELSSNARETIEKLAIAMRKRPEINIEVRPVWSDRDRILFAEEQIKERIKERGGDPDNLRNSRSILEELYQQTFSSRDLSDLRKKHTSESEGEFSSNGNEKAYLEALLTQLANTVTIPKTKLNTLASKRAENILESLKKAGIDGGRIYIMDVKSTAESKEDDVALPLSLRA